MVPLEERIVAQNYIINYLYEFSRIASYKRHYLGRPPRYLLPNSRRLAEESVAYASLSLDELKLEIASLLSDSRAKYRYLDYYMRLHNSLGALVFIAVPPDVVWEGAMDPWYYIRYYFFVHRTHKPVVSRFYSMFLHYYYLQFFKRPEGPLFNIYRQYLERELEKGKRESKAKKHAFRKVVRTIIGNSYLIATLDAIRAGEIEPSGQLLPRFLLEYPEKAETMINPSHYLPGYDDYSWEALVRLVQ